MKKYKCEKCNSETVRVVREYSIVTESVKQVSYSCDNNTETEMEKRFTKKDSYCDWGVLNEDHTIAWLKKDMTGTKEEIPEIGLNSECIEIEKKGAVTRNIWSDIDKESEEYYVYCEGCGRDIEFGWSNPDGTGLIWPVEWDDFDFSSCYPEARYITKWKNREWV